MLYPLCFVSRIRRKAGGPVSQPFYITNKLWDVKERTHCSQRVGHIVPGVVVYLELCRRRVRCDHNGLKRLPEAPLICWRPISPLWFLRNSALGCKWGNWHHSSSIIYHLSSIYLSSSSIYFLYYFLNISLGNDKYKLFDNFLPISCRCSKVEWIFGKLPFFKYRMIYLDILISSLPVSLNLVFK